MLWLQKNGYLSVLFQVPSFSSKLDVVLGVGRSFGVIGPSHLTGYLFKYFAHPGKQKDFRV